MPYAHLFSVLASNVEAIVTHGGYAVLFIFTLLEGVPLVGMAVPGHITIIIAGFFAKVGTLELGWVLLLASVGAVLGDYIGFYIGRKYGMSFIDRLRPYFFITDAHIAKAHELLSKHTGKAMVFGRFSPMTRAIMPFLVGTSKTTDKKFWIFNLIGGVSWAVSSVMIGYVFGAGYHAITGHLGRFALMAVVAAAIIIWGYRFVNMRFHIFKRYELFTLGLNILSLWALAAMIGELASRSFKLGFDVWVSSHVVDPVTHAILMPNSLVQTAYWVSTVGGMAVTGYLGALVGLWLLLRKRWRSAAIMLMAVVSTSIIVPIMKEFFMSPRPIDSLQPILTDPSFPSGHAAMAAAFFLAIAYVSAPKIHSWVKRELMMVACVLATIAIGLSRLVLNVHWVSDVIAGWALGVFLATASILLVRYAGVFFIKKGRYDGEAAIY